MFENPRRGRQARNFTTNVPKILDLKSSSEQIFSENWCWVPLIFAVWSYMFKNWCFWNKLLPEYCVYNLFLFNVFRLSKNPLIFFLVGYALGRSLRDLFEARFSRFFSVPWELMRGRLVASLLCVLLDNICFAEHWPDVTRMNLFISDMQLKFTLNLE